eukprot:jgi/Mesvir1/20762/Mv12767-RA.2
MQAPPGRPGWRGERGLPGPGLKIAADVGLPARPPPSVSPAGKAKKGLAWEIPASPDAGGGDDSAESAESGGGGSNRGNKVSPRPANAPSPAAPQPRRANGRGVAGGDAGQEGEPTGRTDPRDAQRAPGTQVAAPATTMMAPAAAMMAPSTTETGPRIVGGEQGGARGQREWNAAAQGVAQEDQPPRPWWEDSAGSLAQVMGAGAGPPPAVMASRGVPGSGSALVHGGDAPTGQPGGMVPAQASAQELASAQGQAPMAVMGGMPALPPVMAAMMSMPLGPPLGPQQPGTPLVAPPPLPAPIAPDVPNASNPALAGAPAGTNAWSMPYPAPASSQVASTTGQGSGATTHGGMPVGELPVAPAAAHEPYQPTMSALPPLPYQPTTSAMPPLPRAAPSAVPPQISPRLPDGSAPSAGATSPATLARDTASLLSQFNQGPWNASGAGVGPGAEVSTAAPTSGVSAAPPAAAVSSTAVMSGPAQRDGHASGGVDPSAVASAVLPREATRGTAVPAATADVLGSSARHAPVPQDTAPDASTGLAQHPPPPSASDVVAAPPAMLPPLPPSTTGAGATSTVPPPVLHEGQANASSGMAAGPPPAGTAPPSRDRGVAPPRRDASNISVGSVTGREPNGDASTGGGAAGNNAGVQAPGAAQPSKEASSFAAANNAGGNTATHGTGHPAASSNSVATRAASTATVGGSKSATRRLAAAAAVAAHYDAPSLDLSHESDASSGDATLCSAVVVRDVQALRTLAFAPAGCHGGDGGGVLAVGSNSRTLRVVQLGVAPEGGDRARAAEQVAATSRTLLELHDHHVGSIYCAEWSCDGRLLASGSNDHAVKVVPLGEAWWAQAGRADNGLDASMEESSAGGANEMMKLVLSGHTGTVRSVVFSPIHPGLLLSGGTGDCAIRLWDVGRGHCMGILHGHSAAIFTLAVSSDGNVLASGGSEGSVRLWDLRLCGAGGIATSESTGFDSNPSGSVCVGLTSACSSPISSVGIRPIGGPGLQMAVGYVDGICQVLDMRGGGSGTVLQELHHHKGHDCRSVTFSPGSGRWLLTGSFDSSIGVADMATVTQAEPIVPMGAKWQHHTDKVISARWNLNMAGIASCSADHTVRTWLPTKMLK